MLRRQSQSMSDGRPRKSLSEAHRGSIEDLDYSANDLLESSTSTGTSEPANVPSRWVIASALLFTILGFTIQIEAIAYYQDVLGWAKPLFSLYLTHSSLALPWIVHMIYLRFRQHRRLSTRVWLRRYVDDLDGSVSSVIAHRVRLKTGAAATPTKFLCVSMLIVTGVLTVSGVSWFVALAFTTPGDLTAIYNCSAFFAAVFSVPLLGQRLGTTALLAVALSILGTMIIAYGDAGPETSKGEDHESKIGGYRLLGNMVAAIGAVAFGLYSVVFKRWTSVEHPRHARSAFDLAIAASGLTGLYTLGLGWIGIAALHLLGIEEFVAPSAPVLFYLVISILTGATSMTLLLLLVTWTTPVFGSVTSILSVFFVAIADWLLLGITPSLATCMGGALIFVAFGLLARDETAGSR